MRTVELRAPIPALGLALVLLVAACGEEPEDQAGVGGPGTGDVVTGTVVRMARASWDTGFMQAAIYQQLIEELGYVVTEPADETRDAATFYPALARGDLDLWANGWFPLHEIFFDRELFTGQLTEEPIEAVGVQVSAGALQGYLIDKATADQMGIRSMSDLADRGVAATFDRDGDGLADLIGCNEGWGCNVVIDEHIAELDWGSNVEQVVGDYSTLIEEVRSRVEAGEPVLFYTWTPNWTVQVLEPGVDVVWLQSPALEDDEGLTSVGGLRGCAGGADPCDLGWVVNDIRAVANIDFLDANPPIRRLLEVVEIPLDDIAAQNAEMAAAGDYSDEQVAADAAEWVAANRAMADGWLAHARG